MSTLLEHDQEIEPGIPEPLPGGEHVLWKGGPDFRSLLLGSFRLKALSAYFSALLLLQLAAALSSGAGIGTALGTTAGFASLAMIALLMIAGYAWLSARATLFTVTNRRVIMRTGVALPVSINLPYRLIESAQLRLQKDDSGDIFLLPVPGNRVSWMLLWPMVKTFRWVRVRPVLRGLENAPAVAGILGDALTAATAAEGESAPRVDRGGQQAEPDAEPAPRWQPYPTVPLAAMVLLVSVSLVAAGWNVLNDDGGSQAVSAFATRIDLYFEDQDDGAVLVRDAANGEAIDRLEPGTNGFVRATLRGLVRARDSIGAGNEEPFTVGVTESGRVVLYDPVSERLIDLRAFGSKNRAAFTRFLEYSPTASAEPINVDAIVRADTAVALQDEESPQ